MIDYVSANITRGEETDEIQCGIYLAEPVLNGGSLKRRLDTVHSCSVTVFVPGSPAATKTATDNGAGFYTCSLAAAERPATGAGFVLTAAVKEQASSTEHLLEETGQVVGTFTKLVLR